MVFGWIINKIIICTINWMKVNVTEIFVYLLLTVCGGWQEKKSFDVSWVCFCSINILACFLKAVPWKMLGSGRLKLEYKTFYLSSSYPYEKKTSSGSPRIIINANHFLTSLKCPVSVLYNGIFSITSFSFKT